MEVLRGWSNTCEGKKSNRCAKVDVKKRVNNFNGLFNFEKKGKDGSDEDVQIMNIYV